MNAETSLQLRLSEFLQSRFGTERGWAIQAANAMGINYQQLRNYLSGERGKTGLTPKLREALRRIRATQSEIEYIETGSIGVDAITSEERKILERLRKAGIDSVKKVEYFLAGEDLATDIAAAVVREVQHKYGPNKKGSKRKGHKY